MESAKKGKRAALCQPHVAFSATQKPSQDPSSVVHSVLPAIVGGEILYFRSAALRWRVSVSGHGNGECDPKNQARSEVLC